MLHQKLDDMLRIQHPKLINNVEVLDRENLGQAFVIRIDQQKMDKKGFVPMISQRQATTEDRTLPRVVAADTLLGCLKAYPGLIHEYDNYTPNEKGYDKLGYYIHGIEFEYCLKPNNKLVYDASQTGEIWLPRFSDNTSIYYPKILGKIFIRSYSVRAYKGKLDHEVTTEFYIEVTTDTSFKFTRTLELEKGYHSVIVNCKQANIASSKNIVHRILSKDEYLSDKVLQATVESMPIYTKW